MILILYIYHVQNPHKISLIKCLARVADTIMASLILKPILFLDEGTAILFGAAMWKAPENESRFIKATRAVLVTTIPVSLAEMGNHETPFQPTRGKGKPLYSY